MAGLDFTSPSQSFGDVAFNGGLNSTAGPLALKNNEASDIQNIDFSKFGSILKRNGFTQLNSTEIGSAAVNYDGLHWFEFDSSGTTTRFLVAVANGAFFKMDALDGTWDDATNGVTITADNFCDFENFLNKVFFTNNEDPPLEWDGAGTSSLTTMTVPSGLTDAQFVKQFNNYLFLGNVAVSGTRHGSRFYWSNLKDTGTWTATDFIEVAKDDGQVITGMKVLADRLVIFKTRSIYNVFFTGDADIPFILPGGGKSNSSVGCVGPYSIQEVNNGLVFLSHDGFYFYDGFNSFKISDKISTTLLGYNTTRFNQTVSLVQKDKNRYWAAMPDSGQTNNNKIVVWDFFNNAFSIYSGVNASAMATIFVNGDEERPYFGDYLGFTYRADTGTSDNPSGAETAIDAFYTTNWRVYGDLIDQKATPHIALYHQNANTVLSLSYTYDFEDGDQFTQTFSLATSTDVYGTAVYDSAVYAGSGGAVIRRDLKSRGRVIRFKFSNSVVNETFQVDGMGQLAHLETNV